ncbi:MAG: hypothetical protein F4045_12715 [Chloroflexi bacterium]|nr:hypothetical protein [Chloroflexota bacterium]MYK35925.1 hypothetical protein [Chloroflexota bacterium]
MRTVTRHGGTGLRYALGMAELVREHLPQRVLRADVGSVGGTARWPDHPSESGYAVDGHERTAHGTGGDLGMGDVREVEKVAA